MIIPSLVNPTASVGYKLALAKLQSAYVGKNIHLGESGSPKKSTVQQCNAIGNAPYQRLPENSELPERLASEESRNEATADSFRSLHQS
jgi:hypothetical protein